MSNNEIGEDGLLVPNVGLTPPIAGSMCWLDATDDGLWMFVECDNKSAGLNLTEVARNSGPLVFSVFNSLYEELKKRGTHERGNEITAD